MVQIEKYRYPHVPDWADTDLCRWLNTEMIGTLLGDDPILYALMEEGENGKLGKLFCLTTAQFMHEAYGFPAHKEPSHTRICKATPYALSRRLYRNKHLSVVEGASPYWVATVTTKRRSQIVGYDGHLSAGVFTRDNIGIRPAVRLDLSKITVTGGSGTAEDPFTLAFSGEAPEPTEEPPEELIPFVVEDQDEEQNTATPAPKTEMPAPETETPAPDDKTPVPETEAPSPEAESPAPDAETPAPETDTPSPENTESESGTAVVSFLGDCSIGDAYTAVKKGNSYHSVVDKNGYAWPFSEVQEYIGTDDMTVGNLEVVFTDRDERKPIVYPLRADADHVNILLEGSIDVVNTANNHCYDYYRNGYTDTLATLDEAGVGHFGSVNYSKENGFDDVLIRDVNGIRFGFFGFSYPNDRDLKHAKELIDKLREEEHCDYIIASLHWGRETYTMPSKGNVDYARRLLDLGADMLYGHHPHVLQPVAVYGSKPILFSTGNCTFGTLSGGMDQHAAIFRLTFEKTEKGTVVRKLEAIPCKYYKKGDYRIVPETDPAKIAKTYKILSPGKKLQGCDNPPASFLDTGVILFGENGEIVQDP